MLVLRSLKLTQLRIDSLSAHFIHHLIHILIFAQLVYSAPGASKMAAVRDVHSRDVEMTEKSSSSAFMFI